MILSYHSFGCPRQGELEGRCRYYTKTGWCFGRCLWKKIHAQMELKLGEDQMKTYNLRDYYWLAIESTEQVLEEKATSPMGSRQEFGINL